MSNRLISLIVTVQYGNQDILNPIKKVHPLIKIIWGAKSGGKI